MKHTTDHFADALLARWMPACLAVGLFTGCPSASPEPTPNPTDGGEPEPEPLRLALASVPTLSVAAASLHTARANHTSTLLHDGRILVVGGESIGVTRPLLDAVEVYDPTTNVWTELPPLPEPRGAHTATLLSDGQVLIVGGGRLNAVGLPSGLDVAASALLFDPATGETREVGPPVVARHSHVAALLRSGRVLLVGGSGNESYTAPAQGSANPQPFGNELASAEIFDPVTQTFTATGEMAAPRFAFAGITLADGRFLVCGGAQRASTAASLRTSEIFDEATGTFEPAGSLSNDRLFHVATRLSDHRVLAFGGKKANIRMLDDIEVADAAGASWTAGGNAPPARTSAAVVPSDDGGAVLIGGLSCSAAGCSIPTTVQLWSSSGELHDGPELRTPRANPTATVLDDGSVLVVGGFTNESLADVELLVP